MFDLPMEWITDPAVWAGLVTLVLLELVLGIDNLIFIAILADRLPKKEGDRARVIGLSIALLTRVGLLLSITWVMSLTAPVMTILGKSLSWRDLILIGGGLFLLVKATIEIHDRIDAAPTAASRKDGHGKFWPIVAQIVVLDIVFSLDSVITAVGMVDEVAVMIAAVVIAIIGMLFASKPLTYFIIARPTLIILCLGFLLMIGLVLVVDGLGYHVPKGYVYSAIAFALIIETFNQLRARKLRRAGAVPGPRQQIAETVLRLLAGVPIDMERDAGAVNTPAQTAAPAFDPAETDMVRGVLALAARPVKTIMTPRASVEWVELDGTPDEIRARLRVGGHPSVLVCRGGVDEVAGIVGKDALLALLLDRRAGEIGSILRPPVIVTEETSILDALREFKTHPAEIAVVVDAGGRFKGIVTQTDFLRAIAGDQDQHSAAGDAGKVDVAAGA